MRSHKRFSTDYITWQFPSHGGVPDLKATWGGHYFGTDLKGARSDYAERVGKPADYYEVTP